jgi:hypothetical protein
MRSKYRNGNRDFRGSQENAPLMDINSFKLHIMSSHDSLLDKTNVTVEHQHLSIGAKGRYIIILKQNTPNYLIHHVEYLLSLIKIRIKHRMTNVFKGFSVEIDGVFPHEYLINIPRIEKVVQASIPPPPNSENRLSNLGFGSN